MQVYYGVLFTAVKEILARKLLFRAWLPISCFIAAIIFPACIFFGCIPVHLDFIVPVHLEHHTSGSSRPSYFWFIQSFHTSGSSRFHSYIWFIQIFFIPLVHLEHHTSGSSRFFSYLWFIQNFIPLVHIEFFAGFCMQIAYQIEVWSNMTLT